MGRGLDASANVPRWVNKAAAVLGPNVGHYIYISSISVYPNTSKPGIDETTPVATIADPTTEKITGSTYGTLKAGARSEKAAETAMPGKVAVVRPGPDRRAGGSHRPIHVLASGREARVARSSPPVPRTIRSSSSMSATWGNSWSGSIEDKTTGSLERTWARQGADDGPDARGVQAGCQERRDLHLGRRGVSGETGDSRLERYARLGAQ